MIKKFNNMIISPDVSVMDAMAIIEKNAKKIVFVCEQGKLQAVLTDGDIRRYILKKGSLDAKVESVANKDFIYGSAEQSHHEIYELSKKYQLDCVPVLGRQGELVDIKYFNFWEEDIRADLSVPVVIMAGGKGTRLYPYTKVLPKPLIPIGELTITQHIFNQFKKYGCTDFTMIVNHKKNMIKAFFADEDTDYMVDFLEEELPLGTGGGLKLLEGKIKSTFFMSNCDILIFEDYDKLFQYHKKENNILTMVCTTKKVTIPYGIVDIDENGNIDKMTEKPSYSFLTNTGFYVIEPDFLNYIEKNTFVHITEVIQKCINSQCKVGIYPISEYLWSDMGQIEEMEKMRIKLGI